MCFQNLQYIHQQTRENAKEKGYQGCDENYDSEKWAEFELFGIAFFEEHGYNDAEVVIDADQSSDNSNDSDIDKAFLDC